MTEQVSGLRHYIRLGMLSVKTAEGTLLRLINLFMNLFFSGFNSKKATVINIERLPDAALSF